MTVDLSGVHMSSHSEFTAGVFWVLLCHPNLWHQYRPVGRGYFATRVDILHNLLSD